MKKFSKLAFFVLTFVVLTSVASANEIEIGDNGEMRIVPKTKNVIWKKTGVIITPEARQHGNVWKQAFSQPGVVIPVKTHKTIKMIGPFMQRIETIADASVVYMQKIKIIDINKTSGVIEVKEKLNPFLIFWVIAIVFMLVSHFYFARGKKGVGVALAAVTSLVATIILFTVTSVTSFADATLAIVGVAGATTLAIVAAFGVLVYVADAVAGNPENKILLATFRTIFYILMAISAFAMYW